VYKTEVVIERIKFLKRKSALQ